MARGKTTKGNRFSKEQLSAFVDGELPRHETDTIVAASQHDPSLERHLAELQRVRSLVRLAFETSEPARTKVHSRPNLRMGVAAALLLGVGIAIGFALHGPVASPEALLQGGVTLPRAAALSDGLKTIFHINSGDPRQLEHAFTKLEDLLRTYEQAHKHLTLEVIVNADGLNVLRSDTSAYSQRIAQLQSHYDNLTFVACRQTVEQARRNGEVKLLPGVVVGKSALDQIILRLSQGWMYMKA